MTAKKVECDECNGHPFWEKKIEKMCAKQESRDADMKEMDRCKVNKATFSWVVGVVVSMFIGSIGSIIYLVTTVSEVGRNVSMEISQVNSSINQRFTLAMEKTNDKISMIQVDIATIKTQQKDQSERLYGLSSKQTVMLEKMTVNDSDSRGRDRIR